MLDTLSVARRLAAGGIGREQAAVIADAIRQAVEQGDYVTSDRFEAGVAEPRTEIASLETRFVRWMLATATSTVAAVRPMG